MTDKNMVSEQIEINFRPFLSFFNSIPQKIQYFVLNFLLAGKEYRELILMMKT